MQFEIPFVLYLEGILIKHRHINMIILLQCDATIVKMVAGGCCPGNKVFAYHSRILHKFLGQKTCIMVDVGHINAYHTDDDVPGTDIVYVVLCSI
jgi:hypothetical protein